MSEIVVLNQDNYAVETGSGVVVVDFYADWCGPCKMMAPVLEEAEDAYAGRVKFAKVNVDDNQAIAQENSVMGIPTLIFYKDGVAVGRVTGVIDKAALYAKLDELV